MKSVEDSKECVKVVVNVRPLITAELRKGCKDCVTIVTGEPQVQIGSHVFIFDHVYGIPTSPYSSIFDECILPLIDAFFHGYNATVLAYGQPGSGKTSTMGTNYKGEDNCGGIIPEVMNTIFRKIAAVNDITEFLVRVSFIEIFKEEVFDLLDPQSHAAKKSESASTAKPAVARAPIRIRETAMGGITLAGVTKAEVRTKEEMASYLTRGSINRATGSTNTNSQSSRSHAIFTIYMEQKKISHVHDGMIKNEAATDDILFAKLHLVDLAGSGRAKSTGADGLRLKEGIHINRGLLALGNVISALRDEKKRKEGGHVPYRDSKLTRFLQDSLGGNSKTVMIACVSPANANAEETINTLKYANHARNIQNKAMINRDPMAAEMQRMQNQLEKLQAELAFSRGEGAPFKELQIIRQNVSFLKRSAAELNQGLKECRTTLEHLRQSSLDVQVEKDKLILKIESARSAHRQHLRRSTLLRHKLYPNDGA